eukprot:4964368-Heterocapsa_arctica.AAC.1
MRSGSPYTSLVARSHWIGDSNTKCLWISCLPSATGTAQMSMVKPTTHSALGRNGSGSAAKLPWRKRLLRRSLSTSPS